MADLPATIIAVVIDKIPFASRHEAPRSAYDHAMERGLDAVFRYLTARDQAEVSTHIVVERRGRKEYQELELCFRRFCDIGNSYSRALPLDLVMVPKTANSAGLQLADLVARPIGLHVLRPDQPNRAFDTIRSKLHQNATGEIYGYGLLLIP